MSKKFKSQASSARAASAAFGSPSSFGFGSASSSSSLSYITEQPDLSSISDAGLVVSLRNLGKKDSTTKAKALEEIQEHVKNVGADVEDAVITAWVELYPRTSIDNSRRVRQLAHTVQGAITTAAGKRIAPRLPKVVGAWLCGQYDSDRLVARSASQSLNDAFPSSEKQQALWKVYKDSLLDFAEDAILVQSIQTLSDERSTSKDDAESKHARVCGSAMNMLGRLITVNNRSAEFHSKVAEIITRKTLWDFVSHNDSYLCKSVCSLAVMCATEFKNELDWNIISSKFLSKALAEEHLGSSSQYSQALLSLTTTEPAIWTTFYSGKTSSQKRLCQYLKKGSSRGTEDVWRNTVAMIQQIPRPALAKDGSQITIEDVETILDALHAGVTNPDEPRFNSIAAWSCFVDVVFLLLDLLPDGDRDQVFQNHIGALLLAYLNGAKTGASFPVTSAERLTTQIVKGIADSNLQSSFAALWSTLVAKLTEMMRLSLPESSKGFDASQKAVADASDKLLKLEALCYDDHRMMSADIVSQTFEKEDQTLLASAVQLLKDRNFKPYGAAAVLGGVACQKHFDESNPTLGTFLDQNIDQLLKSPSTDQAVSLWKHLGRPKNALLRTVLMIAPQDDRSNHALAMTLGAASQEDIESDPQVLDSLSTQITPAITATLIANPLLQSTRPVKQYFESFLLRTATDSSSDQQTTALSNLSEVIASKPQALSSIQSNEHAGDIVARLLFLADSSDASTAELASSLLSKFNTSRQTSTNGVASNINIIADQLSGKQPLIAILSLVELASTHFQQSDDKMQTLHGVLPSAEQWETALRPRLIQRRPASLAITSPLQGVVYTLAEGSQLAEPILRDSEDFSMAFRLAVYTTKLCSIPSFMETLAAADDVALFEWLPVAVQLVNEKLSLETANEIWINSTPEVFDEAVETVSGGNNIIQKLLSNESCTFTSDWLVRVAELQGNGAETYWRGLAFADIASRSAQRDGGSSIGAQFDTQIKQLHRSRDLIQNAAVAYSAREYLLSSSAGRKVLNELISSVTELKVEGLEITTMSPLILLNIILDGDSEPLQGVPSQRLVFLMQNLVRLLAAATLDLRIESEIFKLLSAVLPVVQDIYGDHWQDILESLVSTWTELNESDDDLPMLNSTLRVYQTLKNLVKKQEDVNEDLQEAWQAKKESLEQGLLDCLQLVGQTDETINQPRQICAQVLGRLLRDVKAKDLLPIYSYLSSPSDAVLETASGLIYAAVPDLQEQLSVDVVLEKQVAHLPPELLELVADFQHPSNPVEKKRYLLSWKLLYRHFDNASYKLRQMYASDLKDHNQLPHLLDIICEDIRITTNRPIDASKLDFTSDQPLQPDSNTTALAVNLYYLTLLNTPDLARTWYLAQKNRIKSPLESWTQKYITPALVAASMDTVTQWSQAQDKEDTPVEIKTNARAAEVVASMPVDPDSPPISIAIVLPADYPLNVPIVVSKTRVLVSDKTWQSWLRTLQIITFSTGSIIEGLVAFRRNVLGVLKGQTECAICYSIIGTDMQTPNKKCGTCKNMFHGACLFRWFKSSNSSTCPLCRNSFSYA